MTSIELPVPLVSVRWLSAHLEHSSVVVLDASMKPPGAAAPAQPDAAYLPYARVFDFDQRICDQNTSLPHMMPSAELFEREVRALGVHRDSAIVVYDRMGVYSSPRAWWMFQAMGHDRVSVLDGGLPAWLAAGLPVREEPESPVAPGDFVAQPRPGLFWDADQVERALGAPGHVVLDARSEGRFSGREPEPRAGLRRGHMPHAINLPFTSVQARGQMLPAAELQRIFGAQVQGSPRMIFSCGSGVTACVLALGARLAGYSDLAVYDGSWSEWGLPSSRPVIGPPAEG